MARGIGRSITTNAGDYRHRITIYRETTDRDADGFPVRQREDVLHAHASIRTTSGYTMIRNDADFEKAYVNFTIRHPHREITTDMLIEFRGKRYAIQYVNNVNEADAALELQAKRVDL